jgi:uncharacterized protein YifN (PemK superfamily)
MSLPYQPRASYVVMCDFTGFVAPEMVKYRDVVVLAPNKQNNKLVTVVPLSTTPPKTVERHHHLLASNPRPHGDQLEQVWAKCDMVYTVALARLDSYFTHTRRGGRQTVNSKVSATDFAAIRAGVAFALNLGDNQAVPVRGLESSSVSALN